MKPFFLFISLYMHMNYQLAAWRYPLPLSYRNPTEDFQGPLPRRQGFPMFYHPWQNRLPVEDHSNSMMFRTADMHKEPSLLWYRPFRRKNRYPNPNIRKKDELAVSMNGEAKRDQYDGSTVRRPYASYSSPYDTSMYSGIEPFFLKNNLHSLYTDILDFPNFLSLKDTTPYQDACQFKPTFQGGDCVCGVDKTHRIYGGEEARVGAHPWMAGIFSSAMDQPFCGATIISYTWVVTAAHCFILRSLENTLTDYRVRVGEYNTMRKEMNEQEIKVKRVIPHSQFQRSTGRNDIALVELEEPMKRSYYVSPVCLPFQFRNCTWEGYDILVAGWGNMKSGDASPILRETNIPVIPLEECKERFPVINQLNLCANAKGKDTCKGDSGGPALIYLKDFVFLAGVVSWGIGCGRPGSPGVYTNVAKYTDWIEEKTGVTFCRT